MSLYLVVEALEGIFFILRLNLCCFLFKI